MMLVFAAFVIIWTFSVSSNRSSADLLPAGCGAYILMPDLNRFVTTADLHNDLLRLRNHTCQFVPLDWSLRQHVSQLQLVRRRRGCRAGRRVRDRRRTVSTTETNDGEIPVLLSSRLKADNSLQVRGRQDVRHRVLRTVSRTAQSINVGAYNADPSLLSCYVINARSLKKNNCVQLLSAELSGADVDVAAVTETWLNKSITAAYTAIPGYSFFRQDRTRRKGGGVGIYSRSSLISEVVETPYHAVGLQSGHEIICVKITKCSQLYLLTVVYHPPKPIYNSHDFLVRLTNDIDYLISTYPHAVLILTGDFNRLDMSEFLNDTGLFLIDTGATRGRHALDLLITNCPDIITCTVTKSCLRTDHSALIVNSALPVAAYHKIRNVVTFPDIRQHHMIRLATAIREQDWSCITAEVDINIVYSTFVDRIKSLIATYIPMKRITVTNNTPSYITPLVRSLLRRRNKLMRRGKVSDATELSGKIGQIIIKHRQDELSNISHKDTKKLWSKVRPVISGCTRPTALGDKYGSQFADLDAINAHFVSVATDPDYDINEISTIIDSVPASGSAPQPISEYEVFKLLNSVKKTSPGHDCIPYWVFKHCAIELTPVVTLLFNIILQTGTPPSSWKTALVTPIPKTAAVKTFSDLRPISVTPILSRLVEKLVVRKHIIPALPSDLIADQFAYRPTGSTTSALISVIHSVTQKLESCTYVRCLLVDYSKAFDMINHPILFRKILTLSMPSTVKRFIFQFLTGRSQAVHSGGRPSDWLSVTRSIIQGSGIGPSLYLVYSMDLKTVSSSNKLVKYADDTTLIVPQYSSVSLEDEYQNLLHWSTLNKLKINTEKTKEIVFRRPGARNFISPASLSGIEQITSVKLLGMHLTATLTATVHVEHILSLANQRLHLLGLLKHQGLSPEALHQIFTSIVQSVITYALPSFAGQLSKGDKSRINALFRKALKRGLCHTSLDIDELIITADKRLFGHISSKTHCLHHLLPPRRNVRTTSSLRTRGHNFTLPHTDFNLYKNSYINRCLFHFL